MEGLEGWVSSVVVGFCLGFRCVAFGVGVETLLGWGLS